MRYWNNPANILLQFREGRAHDVTSLMEALGFGMHEGESSTYYFMVYEAVDRLIKAGMLEWVQDTKTRRLQLTDRWPMVQSALFLSLRELASTNPASRMIITPIFGQPNINKSSDSSDLFVLMPFAPERAHVYDEHIKPVAEQMRLTVRRGDELFGARQIMGDIWDAICSCKIVIADCTGRNSNVFYEMGIAHTVGKSVILISQNPEDVPFDLRHIRYIPYEDLRDRTKSRDFEWSLRSTLRSVLGAESAPDSYYRHFRPGNY